MVHAMLDCIGFVSYFAGAFLLAVHLSVTDVLGKGSAAWQALVIIVWPLVILIAVVTGIIDATGEKK